VQCTVCSVQCTVYSVQCTVYSVQCTVCSVQCAVYSVQCTVCSVQCAVSRVRCCSAISNVVMHPQIYRCFSFLIRIIFANSEALFVERERERERERVGKLETCTLFTAVQCQTGVYTCKLLYIADSLLEFEFTPWNCFLVRLSNSALYELLWSLIIWIYPTLELKICLHNMNYKSCTWLFLLAF